MFTATFAGMSVCVACWFPCFRLACKQPAPVVVYPAPAPVHVKPADDQTGERKEGPAGNVKSLYDRLGGGPAIRAVIDDFVGRAATDSKVNFFRKGTPAEWKPSAEGVDHLKKVLAELVGMVTGGPQKYSGRDMKGVHMGMMITQDEFNALAADLKATLDKFKVPTKEQDELLKIVASTAADIVEKR